MATPLIPVAFNVQQANGEILASWAVTADATSYTLQKSLDQVTYSTIYSGLVPNYLDTAVSVGAEYWYKVQGVGTTGSSGFTTPIPAVPALPGTMSLLQLRTTAQQRADRVNSAFVTTSEWNSYINQSLFELYDILVTAYEDYYAAPPLMLLTNGSNTYALPSDFYKLLGVDLGLNANSNAWVTLKKFNFISRNRYVFPQLQANYLGISGLEYRIVGSNLTFIPTPSGNQYLRVWYIPRMPELLQDTDIADGVNGWLEYVITDAAIKALQKEESDCSLLMAQKQALLKRVEESAVNRDAGLPDTISDTRTRSDRYGGYGGAGGDGPYGGY